MVVGLVSTRITCQVKGEIRGWVGMSSMNDQPFILRWSRLISYGDVLMKCKNILYHHVVVCPDAVFTGFGWGVLIIVSASEFGRSS